MEGSPALNLQDYISIVLRRKWYLIIPAVIGLLGGWVALQYLPKSYKASALIVVKPPVVSSELVPTMGGSTSEERLGLLRQEIMSRKFLEPILLELGPNGISGTGAQGIEDRVDVFRRLIHVETSMAGSPSSNGNIIAFSISFEGEDPQMVMQVTNKIAELFVAQQQEAVSVQVQGTTSFLATELSNLRVRLEKQEAMIADFRKQHMGELPEQLSFNLGAQERAKQELKGVSENLETATTKKTSLQSLLVGGKEGDTITGRLGELRDQLRQLRARYKESYPDVYMTRQQIEQLEALLRDGVAKPDDPATLSGSGGEELSLQMREQDETVDSLKRKKQKLEGQIREYDQRISETPHIEQELMILTRDYENLKNNYQSLLNKQTTATLSKRIEAEQTGGTLRIIDPAYLPTKPFQPDPLRVMLVSLLIGIGCGAGIVVLLENGEASFRKPEELEQALGLPVLAVIPPFPETKNAPLIRKTESVLK